MATNELKSDAQRAKSGTQPTKNGDQSCSRKFNSMLIQSKFIVKAVSSLCLSFTLLSFPHV